MSAAARMRIGTAGAALCLLLAATPARAQRASALLRPTPGLAPPREGVRPWKAALASLVVPGSGQLLTGRRWGWLMMGTDAALLGTGWWAGDRGRQRRDAYQRYADAHWDRQRFLDYVSAWETANGEPWPYAHHSLPPPGEEGHDYYEMIGKYDQFAPGWDDWLPGGVVTYQGVSANRQSYVRKRLIANSYLKWALTSSGLIFLNHLASAVEVLLWSRRQPADRPQVVFLRLPGRPGGPGVPAVQVRFGVGR